MKTTEEDRPAITISGVTIPHNSTPWRVCVNRHPTTRGNRWGWIENAPGHVCWSDDKADGDFNSAAANEAVAQHNQWLEDQKPRSIRLVEINEKIDRAYNTAQRSQQQAAIDQSALNELLKARELIKEAQS